MDGGKYDKKISSFYVLYLWGTYKLLSSYLRMGYVQTLKFVPTKKIIIIYENKNSIFTCQRIFIMFCDRFCITVNSSSSNTLMKIDCSLQYLRDRTLRSFIRGCFKRNEVFIRTTCRQETQEASILRTNRLHSQRSLGTCCTIPICGRCDVFAECEQTDAQ